MPFIEGEDVKATAKDAGNRAFFMILGNFLCSIAFNCFFIPHELLSGGVGGLGIMTQYLSGIPAGIAVFFINLPIFLVGLKFLDKNIIIASFFSGLVNSTWLTLTHSLGSQFFLDDIVVSCIFGGILNGIGMGIMIRNKVLQGGFDIIAAILKKRLNVNIGTGLMITNTVLISLSSLLFGVIPAMYTLISMYIGYTVVDKIQLGFNLKKNLIIISNKSENIAPLIMERLHRGITIVDGVGAYTGEEKHILYCVVTSSQIGKVKEIVQSLDPNAFVVISDAVEVKGHGFKGSEM